jgi:hypothetical protein
VTDTISVPTLDSSSLVDVHINPELRVKVVRGGARAALIVGAWTPFVMRVRNEAGTTATLRATSSHDWLEVRILSEPPLSERLGGTDLESRVLELFAREHGRLEATLAFDVGQGTQDLGYRNELPILFDCRSPGTRRELPDARG